MSTFNSLSYAKQLIKAGVPSDQAEVHALMLQSLYDEEHNKYATKADFLSLSHDVRTHINQLEVKTDRLEGKTDHLETKIVQVETKIVQVETKIDQIETKISAEIADLKTTIYQCKDDFAEFRSDLSALRTSHKYIIWIGGGVATLCLSAFGLCITMFLHTVKI